VCREIYLYAFTSTRENFVIMGEEVGLEILKDLQIFNAPKYEKVIFGIPSIYAPP
jgi:hypothetical protein